MKTFRIFLLILILGSAVRLININQPLLEYNATRQVETAMILRNFMNGGFNFLYPEIDDNGKGPAYLMQEFPLITAPLSVICFFMKNAPEWLMRLFSVIFFMMTAILLYKLVLRYYGGKIALLSAIIFIFSPLSILMSRVFQPDMAMLFFIVGCFYYFLKWQDGGKSSHLVYSILGFIGAVLLKITNLYIALPILFLIFVRREKAIAGYWAKICIFFIVSLIPIIWWWGYHTTVVRNAFPLPHTSTFSAKYLMSSAMFFLTYAPFYAEILRYVVVAALTPVIFIVFLYGVILRKASSQENNFLYVWLLSVILFFLAVPEQSKQEYYMLSLVPVASVFAAMGISSILYKLKNSRWLKMIFASGGAITILFIIYVALPKYMNRPVYSEIVQAGKSIDKSAEKYALVVASHGYGPDLLYYCNRKGWSFLIDRRELKKYLELVKTGVHKDLAKGLLGPIDELEALRRQGASYFVVVDIAALEKNAEFNNYINRNYKCIEKSGSSHAIFDLRKKAV